MPLESDDISKPLIAIVDDDPILRLSVSALLSKRARVMTGTNAHDARRIMLEHKPSLVLLDDIMPGGPTGLSFLEQIKDDPVLSAIPVVMVTASDKKEEMLRGLTAGAVDYVPKPVTSEALLRVVERILARKQNRVILCLRDRAFESAITARLAGLNCIVFGSGDGGQGGMDSLQKESAIVVFDAESLSRDEALRLAKTYPASRFLCLAKDGEVGGQDNAVPTLSVMPFTKDENDVIKRIGLLLAAQRKLA
ncbi:MAG: response regulator [Bdellovibrionales bacterium]